MNQKRGVYTLSGGGEGAGTGQTGAMSFVQQCKAMTGTSVLNNGNELGEFSFVGFPMHKVFSSYDHYMPPNSISCEQPASLERSWISIGPLSSATATSNHSGGVNVGFSDGSVRFIKDSVNLVAWWALGSRGNGEVVSSDAY